jgi:hypothetical protein
MPSPGSEPVASSTARPEDACQPGRSAEHSIEHRCAVRHSVERTILLRSPSRGEMPATLVNIGAGGACIRLADDTLTGCRLVELVMPGREGPRRWPALVVHRNGSLLGLMFDRPRSGEVAHLLSGGGRSRTPQASRDFRLA